MAKAGLTKERAKNNRNLALTIRDKLPQEIVFEFYMAIVAGHNPIVMPNKHKPFGYAVEWPEHEVAPDLKTRMEALGILVARGWGNPVQSIQLEGEIRQLQMTLTGDLNSEALQSLPYDVKSQIVQLVLEAGKQEKATSSDVTDPTDVIDAEFSETKSEVDDTKPDPDQ